MLNSKKQVYIHQFMSASSRNLLPLAAGLIYSYARSIPKIRDNCNLCIDIVRDKPYQIVARYEKPDLLAYSLYFWNFNQSMEVARLAKEKYPESITVFGGPMVPLGENDTNEFSQRYPFADLVVAGEGEIVFSDILQALVDGKDLSKPVGVCYRNPRKNKIVYKKKRPYIKDLSKIPSPYLDGTFDELFEKYHNIFTGSIFETNRGCPYSCTYCYWGGPDTRVTTFPLDRVFAELDWQSRHKVNYFSGADANFGLLDRDIEIARYIVKLHNETGYPKYLSINWAKNSNSKVFSIADVLNKSNVKFMLTSSVQSYNPPTLKAIGRNNINYNTFNDLLKITEREKYHIHYSEFILGLPLETYESFVKGVEKSMVYNLNYFFSIYYCFVIPSTQMATPEYREKYKIETRRCLVNFERTVDIKDTVPEYEEIVVGTSTMPIGDWKRAFTFGYFIKALYCYRMVYFIFNYLRMKHNVDLIELVEFMITECNKNPLYKVISGALSALERLQDSILNNDRETIKLEGVKTSLHPEVAAFIILLSDKAAFYQELYRCLDRYFEKKGIEPSRDIHNEIFAYQFSLIPTWKDKNLHKLKFEYNVHEFFSSNRSELEKKPNMIIVGDDLSFEDQDDFMGKQIYGGLRFYISEIKPCDDKFAHGFINAGDIFRSLALAYRSYI